MDLETELAPLATEKVDEKDEGMGDLSALHLEFPSEVRYKYYYHPARIDQCTDIQIEMAGLGKDIPYSEKRGMDLARHGKDSHNDN